MAELTLEQRTVITSEDYMNLIIDYRNNPQFLTQVPNSMVQIMNDSFAVAYLPVSEIGNNRLIGPLGYSVIPNLYGLTSEVAVEASGVDKLRKIPTLNLRGAGVLLGIIDTGINYNLPVFKNSDGTTKIYSIWDQNIASDNFPKPELFGTEYSRDQINQAIQTADPLSVVPSTDDNGHGTALAAIAAGNEVKTASFAGVAPEAELIIVKLRPAKKVLKDYFVVPGDIVCYQEDYIMWGIQYCVKIARLANKPISICLGFGTSQGAHNGRSTINKFTSILAGFPKTALTTSAGNEGNLGRHFEGIINPSIGSIPVELNVAENEGGFSMELWGASPGIFSIDILSPSGEYIPRITGNLRISRQISFIFEPTVIDIDYQIIERETGDQLILMRFHNISSGTWKFTVYGQSDLSTSFHIWLPMGNMISTETRFVQPSIYTTVLAPGDSAIAFTVTAYNPLNNTLYVNASRGYTATNDTKPELAAPGVNYPAPDKDGKFINYSGTGIASAHGAGIAALLLEWGVVLRNQPNLSTVEIKNYLIRGARRSNNLTYPNRDWGYGIIDLYNTFNVLRSIL